jgi:hypothetical protein
MHSTITIDDGKSDVHYHHISIMTASIIVITVLKYYTNSMSAIIFDCD